MDFWKNQLKHFLNDERLETFMKSIDQQLDQSLKQFDKHLNHFQSNYFFHVETSETEEEIIIQATLPMEENDRLNLEVVNHQIRILIQKFESEELRNEKGETLRKENYSKRIERYLPLPPNIAPEQIRAAMSGNRLTVKIPKKPGDDSRIINIDMD